jgi:hypothetical protein
MIRRDVVNGSGVDISFEAPTKEWAAKRTTPTLNIYLYDIREDTSRREVKYEEVRDDTGRVTERRQPPRRFRLSYLITAWTQRPEDEHRLLSSMLGLFLRSDLLPADVLAGALRDAGRPTIVQVALPPSEERSISDVWSALGGELKPSLDLVVIAPFTSFRTEVDIAPPVRESPRFTIARDDTGPEEIAKGRRKRNGGGTAAQQAADDAMAAAQDKAVAAAREAAGKGTGAKAGGRGGRGAASAGEAEADDESGTGAGSAGEAGGAGGSAAANRAGGAAASGAGGAGGAGGGAGGRGAGGASGSRGVRSVRRGWGRGAVSESDAPLAEDVMQPGGDDAPGRVLKVHEMPRTHP